MTAEMAAIIAAAISLLGSVIMALVAWGWKGQIATLRAVMDTLRAELKGEISNSTLNFYNQVNGNYLKKEVWTALHAADVARLDGFENRLSGMED